MTSRPSLGWVCLVLALPAAPPARAQLQAADGLAWDLIDEDCGAVPDARSVPLAAPTRAAEGVAAVATPTIPRTTSAAIVVRPPTGAPSQDGTLPRGRSVGRLTASECEAVLVAEGVAFTRVGSDEASGAIEQPIRLTSELRGIAIRPSGGDPASIHSILDCRLAVALLGWSDALREAGFVAIEHVSIFRPGARVARTHRPSGHSHALAIDALRLVRADGTHFSVLEDWAARERGTEPCETYDETEASRTVRGLVCGAIAAETFQVVITPHHDDAHANHLHLEIVPGVSWTVAR